ncbi:hypothetical protein KIH41_07235 [Litoribacter ruber]|uniref:Uncharacterized protein n=1 Tax=Litoribacter ruber TaxID=702568 RepID=A0AAP2CE00_9BACT|nr:hypothetical protein [Litoribacter ruber]MBS9522538.1 hypothetical protein [Litoribacter alkaliphilus]MBT0811069.1 hypothetical protein [Litoribacter ruber]
MISLIFASCATVNLNSHLLDPDSQGMKYQRILLLYSDSEEMFYDWDEENYNYVLYGKFNSLAQEKFRRDLGQSISRNLAGTRIFSADQFFAIHRPVSYQDFMNKLSEIDVDGILVVNARAIYQDEVFIDGDSVFRSNMEFQCFLIDKNNLSNVYLAQIGAHGAPIHSSMNVMDRFASNLGKDLHAKGLISNPRTFAQYPR